MSSTEKKKVARASGEKLRANNPLTHDLLAPLAGCGPAAWRLRDIGRTWTAATKVL